MNKNTKKIVRITSMAVVLWIIFAVIAFYVPGYDERLVLDIRNNTFKTIENAVISYSDTPTTIKLEPIKPFERIIIMPYKESERTLATSVYITYRDETKDVINNYRTKSSDNAIITFHYDGIAVKHDDYMGNPLNGISLRPYTKVYDLDGTDWDGTPPLIQLIKGMFFKE